MATSVSFQIISIFYSILLICVYFSKQRLKTSENKIYSMIIIANFLLLIVDILSVYTIVNWELLPVLNIIVTKTYLIFLFLWIILFAAYVFIISEKGDKKNFNNKIYNKKIFSLSAAIYFIFSTIIAVLPIYYERSDIGSYSYGPSVVCLYIISGICIFIWIVRLLSNFKHIKTIKVLPIFVFFTLAIAVMVVQMLNPSLLLMSTMLTVVTFLMYFTIENPDLKLINELNLAREQAEKANSAKTDFLSNMSHEIRTPLNAIVGFSQSLAEQDIPITAKDDVHDIIMASENLLEIVNGILDISKIEADKLEIINSKYSFQKVLDELVILTKGRLGDKPLDFRVKFDPGIPPVLYGDYTRIKQIILNLLTNSVKYTKAGFVEFKVDTFKKGDVCRLIISVEDSGIGIKKDKIESLFNKFERVDVERNISIEGTGLGLAIAKRLVELMNGQIVVQSVYGSGSKFTVAIDQKITEGEAINVNKYEVKQSGELDLSNKRVLIVDDNKVNLKVAARLLSSFNLEIDQVQSGQECLDRINVGEKYDLIFMDDMMPRMSGVETFKRLKELETFDIPTIALTANAIAGMKEKYLSQGFDDYLSKPINRTELDIVVNKYLNK
jgi:Signal transduction histidine kinase